MDHLDTLATTVDTGCTEGDTHPDMDHTEVDMDHTEGDMDQAVTAVDTVPAVDTVLEVTDLDTESQESTPALLCTSHTQFPYL